MLYLILMLQAPFENFTGLKFLLFHRSIVRRYWRGGVAGAAEEIIRETCKEHDIEIITNFLEGHIKNRKKSKSFYTAMSYL